MSLYENPQSSESAAALTSGHPVDYGCKSVMVAPPPPTECWDFSVCDLTALVPVILLL